MTLAELRRMMPHMPFNALLGLEVKEIHDDGITIECPIRPDLWNGMGVVHGGVTATLADAAVGMALMQKHGGEQPATTVEMKVNYLRPAGKGSLLARSHLLKAGTTLAVGRVDIHDSAAHLIATALITYMYVGRKGTSVS
jgi:acyl-CoA thioesterase